MCYNEVHANNLLSETERTLYMTIGGRCKQGYYVTL